MKETSVTNNRSTCLIHPYVDFWLLGGASIAFWLVISIAHFGREHSFSIEQRFSQIAITFAALSLFCNHPHFMISYRFGYGRGVKFIFQNWFALIAVPVMLVAMFASAFVFFNKDVSGSAVVASINEALRFIGVGYRFGNSLYFGDDLLGLSVWLMYFTVGWHYTKQVFGCMMVYAFYTRYPLTALQKRVIKWSLFSVAFFQFTYLYSVSDAYAAGVMLSPTGFGIAPLGLPSVLKMVSLPIFLIFLILAIGLVFFKNYREHHRLPPINFFIPWLALYIWWTPLFIRPEFTFWMVPFFHSLQYLPFAWRMESPGIPRDRWYYVNLTTRISLLLLIGFLAFELIPNKLDVMLDSATLRIPSFFLTAAAVFMNVHHFFIDSVVWKFNQSDVREHLLFDGTQTRESNHLGVSA